MQRLSFFSGAVRSGLRYIGWVLFSPAGEDGDVGRFGGWLGGCGRLRLIRLFSLALFGGKMSWRKWVHEGYGSEKGGGKATMLDC